MANGIILVDDQTDDIIFSGPDWPSNLNNMQDPRLSKVARSADATVENTTFFMAYPDPITIEDYILIGTNIDEDAMIRLTAYSDAEFSIQTYTSGLVEAWTSSSPISDPDFKGVPIILDLGEAVTAAYWQVEIQNTANADGYIQIGKGFMGRRLGITRNFSPGSGMERDPKTQIQEALAGAQYYSRHKSKRIWTLNYPHESYDNAWDELDKYFEISGLDRPVFVIPFPDDLERKQRQSFLGTFQRISGLQLLNVDLASTSINIVEYVG